MYARQRDDSGGGPVVGVVGLLGVRCRCRGVVAGLGLARCPVGLGRLGDTAVLSLVVPIIVPMHAWLCGLRRENKTVCQTTMVLSTRVVVPYICTYSGHMRNPFRKRVVWWLRTASFLTTYVIARTLLLA